MTTKSPVYSAGEKILDLFDLTDKIALYSYRDDFEILWELSGSILGEEERILCILDDSENRSKWLSLGIWGAFYRSCHKRRLILLGKKETLYPFYIDMFSFDEGTDCIAVNSHDFVVQLLKTAQKEVSGSLNEEIINSWQGLIFSYLSAPGDRHAVSNEIAPLVLTEALQGLMSVVGNPMIEADCAAIETVISKEKQALLRLWKWTSSASSCQVLSSADVKNALEQSRMTDIWGKWSDKTFLLIDDQAEINSYADILRCALRLMIGDKCSLVSSQVILSKDEVRKYNCLFLDLRLSETDNKAENYRELPAVKLALDICQEDPAFPIIIFSSSQKRELDVIFSEHKNIVTCFRKPGIAGSSESIDGNIALINLFKAIRRALEIIENRVVYELLNSMPATPFFKAHNRPPLLINIDKEQIKQLLLLVFGEERYEKAFNFPYSFFEAYFTEETVFSLVPLLKAIRMNKKTIRDIKGLDILTTKGETVLLKHLQVDKARFTEAQYYLKALKQFRNLASHGIRNLTEFRRVAIAILFMFFKMLHPGLSVLTDSIRKEDLENLGAIKLTLFTENKETFVNFPLTRYYYSKSAGEEAVRQQIAELLGAICYYSGKGQEIYDLYGELK